MPPPSFASCLPCHPSFLVQSTFTFIPSTLILSAVYVAANRADKASILGDLVQGDRQTLSPPTKEPQPCTSICKCGQEAHGVLQWTSRVSLIWVLWEGLLEGVIIKLHAAGSAGVLQGRGRDTVPGRGDSKGKDPEASLKCSRSWRHANKAGASRETGRLTRGSVGRRQVITLIYF